MKLSSLLRRYYSSLVLYYVVFVRSPPHTYAPYNLSSGEVELRWGPEHSQEKLERRETTRKRRGNEKRKDGNWIHAEEEVEKKRTNELDDNVYSAEKMGEAERKKGAEGS